MDKYVFTCPVCGSNRIVEVRETVVFQDVWVEDDGDVGYGDMDEQNTNTLQYQCHDCDHVLKDVNYDNLPEFIKKNMRQAKLKKLLKKEA